jgi:hypothetical protein
VLARRDAAGSEEAVLRLLCDPREGVMDAMAASLLEIRREAAIPLLLRSLGRQRAAGQSLLERLLESELDDVDVRGTIVSVLLDTSDRDEIAGALSAVGWLTPSGGFPGSAASHARVLLLCDDPDEAIRVLAQAARVPGACARQVVQRGPSSAIWQCAPVSLGRSRPSQCAPRSPALPAPARMPASERPFGTASEEE